MGIEEAALAIAITSAVAGAGASYSAAQSQNRSARKARQSAQAATATKQTQLTQAAEAARLERVREAQKIRARTVIAATESGFDANSGSFEALLRQNDADTSYNLGLLGANYANERALVASGLEADLARLQGQRVNPVLTSLTGGLQGFGSGLQIGTGVGQLGGPYEPNGTEEDFFHTPGGR